MNNQEQIDEVLFQLEQDNFQFAEKLINIFQLDCFEKEDWGFHYQKDEIEIEFYSMEQKNGAKTENFIAMTTNLLLLMLMEQNFGGKTENIIVGATNLLLFILMEKNNGGKTINSTATAINLLLFMLMELNIGSKTEKLLALGTSLLLFVLMEQKNGGKFRCYTPINNHPPPSFTMGKQGRFLINKHEKKS